MFDQLIESKAKRQRSLGSLTTSTILHVVVISAAVYGTLHASEKMEKPKAEKIDFVKVKKDEPPPPKTEEPPPPIMKAPPPKGFQVLQAPIKIPDVIPQIDLNKKATDESDFTGKGVVGGNSKGVEKPNNDQPYFEFQVEKQVQVAPGNGAPRYPDVLRSANVEGEVLAQFVVDSSGRADMSQFKPLKSSHELFTQAVKAWLPNAHFYPAEVGGKKVKQLVQMPFQFNLAK